MSVLFVGIYINKVRLVNINSPEDNKLDYLGVMSICNRENYIFVPSSYMK